MGGFRTKIFNEAEEIASLNMGARNQYSSINFLGQSVSKVYLKFFCLIYVISTLFFLVAGKLVEYPRLLIISPPLLNNF